jgi:hypothetical protein
VNASEEKIGQPQAVPEESVKEAARRLLAKLGANGISAIAVAEELAVAPERITETFAHSHDLLTALIIDAYDASATVMEQADLDARARQAGPGGRLLAAARGLRQWSITNPAEFALIYGSPVPGYDAPPETVPPAARTPAVLAGIVRAALEEGVLEPPRRPIPGPPLIRQEAAEVFGGLPPEPYGDLLERGIVLWSNIIGLLVFEVFSRTHDSVRDQGAFFDYAIAVTAEHIGLAVPAGDTD